MSNEKQETVAGIVAEMRNDGHAGDSSCLEWVGAKLLSYADRIEAAANREHEATCEKSSRVGNSAKMREALSDACYAMFNFLKTQNGGYEEMAKALDKAKAALAVTPRNCDRPECATTKAAQDVWSKEDGGKTAYYEWLLATYTEGGTTDGKKH